MYILKINNRNYKKLEMGKNEGKNINI